MSRARIEKIKIGSSATLRVGTKPVTGLCHINKNWERYFQIFFLNSYAFFFPIRALCIGENSREISNKFLNRVRGPGT